MLILFYAKFKIFMYFTYRKRERDKHALFPSRRYTRINYIFSLDILKIIPKIDRIISNAHITINVIDNSKDQNESKGRGYTRSWLIVKQIAMISPITFIIKNIKDNTKSAINIFLFSLLIILLQ